MKDHAGLAWVVVKIVQHARNLHAIGILRNAPFRPTAESARLSLKSGLQGRVQSICW